MPLHNHQNLVSSINPRAKRLSLRVDQREGVIRLTIPKWTMQWKIDRFLKANDDWIKEKSALLLPKIEISNGAIIPFKGIDHTIVIKPHSKRTTEISSLRGDKIDEAIQNSTINKNSKLLRFARNNAVILIKTNRDDPTSNLKRWMIEECRKIIEPLSHQKATQINKTIEKIDLRDTKSRWGSCSTDKRLMFSWRLIMSPPEVLDYVVAHEVAHLQHMDHSKAFWSVCDNLTEGDMNECRQWLHDHGNELMRYF